MLKPEARLKVIRSWAELSDQRTGRFFFADFNLPAIRPIRYVRKFSYQTNQLGMNMVQTMAEGYAMSIYTSNWIFKHKACPISS